MLTEEQPWPGLRETERGTPVRPAREMKNCLRGEVKVAQEREQRMAEREGLGTFLP